MSDSVQNGANGHAPTSRLPGPVTALLEAASQPTVAVDGSGAIRYANRRALTFFGVTDEEILGRPVEGVLPHEHGERHQRHVARFFRSPVERPTTCELPLLARRRDGAHVPVEVSVTPVPLEDGEPHVVATITDVAARRAEQERIRALNRAYLTLAKISQAVIRSRDVESLFGETCRIAVEQKGYLGAWVAMRDGDRVLRVGAAGPIAEHVSRLRICLDPSHPHGSSPTAQAIRERRPAYVPDFASSALDPRWKELAAEYGVRSMAALPLRRGGEVVAALVLYADRRDAFTQRVRALLEQVASNVSYALDGLAASDRLREVAAQRAELMQRVVTAQEDERVRIAGDIHDESVQALAAIDLRLGLLKGRLRDAAPDLEPSVTQIQGTLATAIAGLRTLLFELEPGDLEAGLVAALEETAERVFEQHPVAWRLVRGEGVDLSPLTAIEQTQALRILKEALVNVRKHSLAESVEIQVRNLDAGVEFVVSDDGVGGDSLGHPQRVGHRGLQTMRDRAAVVGGWLRLEPGPTGGVTVRFWMPASGAVTEGSDLR